MLEFFGQRVSGILFDVDGTLVDSNDFHARAFVEAFAVYGFQVPYASVRACIGMGGDKLVRTLLEGRIEKECIEKINEAKSDIFQSKHLSAIVAFPGAKSFVEQVRQRKIRTGIASSAGKEELAALLSVTGLEGLFDAETSSDDAERSKPDPDIVLAALDKIDGSKEQVVLIGDTPYDIVAASQAGIRTIAVRSGGWNDESLKGAIAVVNDIASLGSQIH
jgi:HAD superfamily hydrolase (TIGR01509 family)